MKKLKNLIWKLVEENEYRITFPTEFRQGIKIFEHLPERFEGTADQWCDFINRIDFSNFYIEYYFRSRHEIVFCLKSNDYNEEYNEYATVYTHPVVWVEARKAEIC